MRHIVFACSLVLLAANYTLTVAETGAASVPPSNNIAEAGELLDRAWAAARTIPDDAPDPPTNEVLTEPDPHHSRNRTVMPVAATMVRAGAASKVKHLCDQLVADKLALPEERDAIFRAIAEEQAQIGDFDPAKATADEIGHDSDTDRVAVLCEIAVAQARSGKITEANATVAGIGAIRPDIHFLITRANYGIAVAQADAQVKAGNLAAAERTIGEMREDLRVHGWADITSDLASSRRIPEAQKCAELIGTGSPKEKSRALLAIEKAQILAGDFAGARLTAPGVTERSDQLQLPQLFPRRSSELAGDPPSATSMEIEKDVRAMILLADSQAQEHQFAVARGTLTAAFEKSEYIAVPRHVYRPQKVVSDLVVPDEEIRRRDSVRTSIAESMIKAREPRIAEKILQRTHEPYLAVAARLTRSGNAKDVAAWIDFISDPTAQAEALLGAAQGLLPPEPSRAVELTFPIE